MDAATLNDAIIDAGCPTISTSVGKADDRTTWSFIPADNATQTQIDAGNNVVATIPIDTLGTLETAEFISRWTNAEYKALQLRRTSDNGKTAKDWDVVTADRTIPLDKKRTKNLAADLVAAGILTQARADEIFA